MLVLSTFGTTVRAPNQGRLDAPLSALVRVMDYEVDSTLLYYGARVHLW